MRLSVVWALFSVFIVKCFAIPSVPVLDLNDGRKIPGIALGTWLGNTTQGRIQPGLNEVEQAVSWALDAGYRHIDTAAAYRIEDQVGRGVNKKIAEGIKREDVFVTTKLWNNAHAREAVVPALRESLDKLNLDYVDLYLMHWPIGQFLNLTYDYTDYVETWRGMIEAKNLGLAKSIGVSNFNQDQINRILEHGLEKPAVLQVEVNLNLQQPSLLDFCKAQNIVVMGYTPFGSLFPSKARPNAPPPRIDDPALMGIATRHNKTVPQIILRYLMDLGVIPIPKSLHKSRIEENIDIFDFSLQPEERDLLKNYDSSYRTIPQYKWLDHPYYPFEKNKTI